MSEDKIKEEENSTENKMGTEESQYERLAQKTAEFLTSVKEKTPETLEKVVEKAKKELVEAGEIGSKKAEEFSEYLKKDLNLSMKDFSKLTDVIKDKSNPSRVGAGILNIFHDITKTLGEQLSNIAAKTEEKLTYKTGKITGPGTLKCNKCGKELHLTKVSRIPPCSGCKAAASFKKSY